MKRGRVLKSIFSSFLMVLLLWGTTVIAAELRVPADYPSIQEAINAAEPGTVIRVADGKYSGNLLIQKAITLQSVNGAENCVIDCANQSRGVTFVGPGASGAVLSGFTIIGGNGQGPGNSEGTDPWKGFGGAILFQDTASASISNCVMSGNTADRGGAIASIKSSPTISHCVMEDNVALYGGGLFIQNGSASDPSPSLIACTIANNRAEKRGGGVFLIMYASPAFYNCLIAGNSASDRGGAFYCYYQCAPDIIHCTVSDNTAADGGGIYCLSCPDPYYPVVKNSIIWGNATTSGADIYLYSSLFDITFSVFNPEAVFSNIQLLGTSSSELEDGNLHEDPAFIGEGDYHLSPESPCIDMGTDQIELPEFDIEGEQRVAGRAPDMGAYEFVPEPEVITVEIDIKPGCAENKINLKSFGLLAIAVKTTQEFDVKTIDPRTVEFSGAKAVWRTYYDMDRDRDKDMLFFFWIQSLNLDENSTEATLSGLTGDGQAFEGTDTVTIIKPKGKAKGWHFGRR